MYYFAYGSNLSKEQMHDRCPDSEFVSTGRLARHHLEFSKYSGRWSGGVADVVKDHQSDVWGYVYRITEDDLDLLDGFEGYPDSYDRKQVTIYCPKDKVLRNVWCYYIAENTGWISPSKKYLGIIKKAAKQFPKAYQEMLAKVPIIKASPKVSSGGLFGWIKTTTTNLDLYEITKAGLEACVLRGENGTGIYSPNNGLVKSTLSSDEFTIPKEIANEDFIMCHARKATTGGIATKNVQPLQGKQFVTLHVGTISYMMPKLSAYKYKTSTLSENVLAYAEETSLRNALTSIEGTATIVIYDKKKKTITFWTNGECPLAICLYKGTIFFASTRSIINNVLQPDVDLGIFPDIKFATLYELEPVTYDLTKGEFTREKPINPKPKREPKALPAPRKQLQRGCAPNMCGPKTVRVNKAGNKSYTVN